MAASLNVFKTITAELTANNVVLYTTPTGYSGIVLMAQITNVTNNTAKATFILDSLSSNTELLKDFEISGNDAISATIGKLIIETGYSVRGYSDANNQLKITLSILESANE
jgi:galactokinase/mevalonate kinase-like predicted kinase